MNPRIVGALVLRYTYLFRRSVPRLLEMVFWPVMDLLVWGFVTAYLMRLNPGVPGLVTFLLGAMIFWDILYRSQQGISISFLEDLWSRNLLNVFVAPVRVREFLAATCVVGLIKVCVIVVVLVVISRAMYGFDLMALGLSLIPFFVNLVLMGWVLGMCTVALILRYGMAVEALAWAIPFLIQPLSAVFYPVNVLPAWLQPVAWCVPATHVFEGMRQMMRGEALPVDLLVRAFALNAIYLVAAGWFFAFMFRSARVRGYLTKIGLQ
jgi:ABC-2 type transport system permease protein